MFRGILYSFPVQLLINHIKRNKSLLFFWFILFSVVIGYLGSVLELHYLFLNPEYLGKSSFWSFLIVGMALGCFTMAFHVTAYIIDIHRFPFVGALSRPFNKFCLNNSIIPSIYLITYIGTIAYFQLVNQQCTISEMAFKVIGLLVGYAFVLFSMFSYMYVTYRDINTYIPQDTFSRISQGLFFRISRARKRLLSQKEPFTVDNYLYTPWSVRRTKDLERHYYNTDAILKIFNQTQRNLVLFEVLIVILLGILGFLADYSAFSQIPAAATGILLLTTLVMFTGLLSFWTRGWLPTVLIIISAILNYIPVRTALVHQDGSHALGLDYKTKKASYALAQIRNLNSKDNYLQDKKKTLSILNNWRKKFPASKPPKLVIVCASGGGQRAALWALNVLQTAEKQTKERLMKHTMLMSCVSGGAIGTSYFRELYLKKQLGEKIKLYDKTYLERMSRDLYTPVVFSLVTNDILFDISTCNYQGMRYRRDRGYALEEQLNKHTAHILDKPLKHYKAPELNSTIPMLFLTPTIANDGRKLFISPHNVSYMGASIALDGLPSQELKGKIKGIDFMRCFENQKSGDLRFLTALRMNASLPYIFPSVVLPSEPAIEVVDAALFDNFGVTDAVRFLYVFKDWIAKNTSEVGLVIIRSSAKEKEAKAKSRRSLWDILISPIDNIRTSWENMQDIRNDDLIEYTSPWFKKDITTVEFQYALPPEDDEFPIWKKKKKNIFSWHVTTREKKDILQAIHSRPNKAALKKLKEFLQ